MPGKRLDGIGEYEKKAREIMDDYSRPYEERTENVENLLKEFCSMNGGYAA